MSTDGHVVTARYDEAALPDPKPSIEHVVHEYDIFPGGVTK